MAACRMNDSYQHIHVLLTEVIQHLIHHTVGVYIDATFGRGSHAKAILKLLNADGRLIAIDKDPEAVHYGKKHFAYDTRFSIFHASFGSLETILLDLNLLGMVKGVLLDLGVSSPQLDNPDRGFSFKKPGLLDMRMDTTQKEDAASWLAKVDEISLANILWQYGEEKKSRKIARAIVNARQISPITTTTQLAEIITKIIPAYQYPNKDAATRSFQAIRIAFNHELTELEQILDKMSTILAIGGRLAVIRYHSLEDRIVKQFIRTQQNGPPLPRGLPIKNPSFVPRFKEVVKPIKPSLKEVNYNPRARSAILRITEKLS
jgi:16S rRNA (cytosine1402-N4)-methyltransferase